MLQEAQCPDLANGNICAQHCMCAWRPARRPSRLTGRAFALVGRSIVCGLSVKWYWGTHTLISGLGGALFYE
eukprot:1159588-Pelagomonas_calceolata.AAC.4